MVDTETLMDGAVTLAGGVRVDRLLDPNDPQRPDNADYVFRQDNAVAELKSLQEGLISASYPTKLERLFQSWHDRRLLRVYGHTVVQMRDLPLGCQQEWMRLLTLSLQTNVISKANKQIERTKEELKISGARGILLLANDGNLNFDPYNLIVLVSHILKKVHSNGSRQYSCIDAVVFFSANLTICSSEAATPAMWWFNGLRPFSTAEMAQTLHKLEACWYERLSSEFGYEIPRFQLSEKDLPSVRFLQETSPAKVILKR